MKLVMVMKVRDEIDVVEQTLRYHLALGADQWIVTDNGSTDGTLEVLKRFESEGLLRLIEEPGENFRTEAHGWVTRMARLAATEMDADWVAHVDADEFWLPAEGSLTDSLEAIPDEYGVVLAPRPEFATRSGEGEWWERMTVRESRSRLRPKIAHRADPEVVLHRGAHDVDIEGEEGGSKHAGRAVMRAVKEDADHAADSRLVWSPIFPARVMHFPLRSFEQYKRRVETTIFHGGFSDQAHQDLRDAYDDGRLPELYEKLALSDAEAKAGIEEGRLVEDTRIRDFLRETGTGPPIPAAVEAELAEIRHDAMQTLARTQRSLVRQLDNFRERVAKQRKRLKAAESGGRLRRLVGGG
ncbi:MAG: glycosyltransferase family 2 protein [Solirubrobacterales bacterium]